MIKFTSLLLKNIHKLLFSIKPFVISIDNIKMYVAPRSWDILIIKEIWFDLCYLPSFPQSKNLNIKTIVDLGGQNGYFTLWALNKFNPEKVVTVEPFQKHADRIKNSLKENHRQGSVTLIEKAIYKDNSKVSLKHTPFNSGLTRLDTEANNAKIDGISFDTVINTNNIDNVDLMKIDIEGSEKYIFTEDNTNLLKSKVKYIVMETHDVLGYSTEDAIKYLEGIGFSCKSNKTWWLPGVSHVEAANNNLLKDPNAIINE